MAAPAEDFARGSIAKTAASRSATACDYIGKWDYKNVEVGGMMVPSFPTELKAHGVTEPGLNLTKELVAVLQYKLDERVVDIISTILQRNSMSKLTADDVKFLQPPDAQPTSHFKYAVTKKVRYSDHPS